MSGASKKKIMTAGGEVVEHHEPTVLESGFVDLGGAFIYRNNHELMEALRPGVYSIQSSMEYGMMFVPKKLTTDAMLDLNGTTETTILLEVEQFLQAKEKYRSYEVIHKRGILLHGGPGNGKTGVINRIVARYVRNQDYVIYFNDSSASVVADGLKMMNKTTPDKQLLVVIEDLDNLMKYESHILSLFDGENQAQNVVFLATTNYLDRLSPRLLRPSRFDTKVTVPAPTAESRRIYLQSKLNAEDAHMLVELTELTEGLSLAELKEALISVTCLGKTVSDAVATITGNQTLIENAKPLPPRRGLFDLLEEE